MGAIQEKARILAGALKGEALKLGVRSGLLKKRRADSRPSGLGRPLVVSLTSYGRRVASCAPLAIASIMRQTVRPDAIVLSLDSDNWSSGNLPREIRELEALGLSVRFVDDTRSYKKLVPVLQNPELGEEELVVTIDDDMYYGKRMLEELVESWKKNPGAIHVHSARRPEFGADGKPMPYRSWRNAEPGSCETGLVPLGGTGCLYSRELLHGDVASQDIFMKLCPHADDLWFAAMERLKGISVQVCEGKGTAYNPTDFFYQVIHKGESLWSRNSGEDGNDAQFRGIIEHYGLSDWTMNGHNRIKEQ